MKTKHLVTYENIQELNCVIMAQLGIGTEAICEETGLSPSQVTYRISKAQHLEGYEKRHTYRSEWRRGTGHAVRSALRNAGPSMRQDAKLTLPKLISHPTPEVSPHK
jgi:hypothetical protein